jgi:tRNA(Arg) A34 adenosine deaminase TadA
MAIAAAAPALIDRVEPNCSMCSTAVQAARIGSLSPGPSCPKTSTHSRGRS